MRHGFLVCLTLGLSTMMGSGEAFLPRKPLATSPTMSASASDTDPAEDITYPALTNSALSRYQSTHAQSLENVGEFWAPRAREYLDWDVDFSDALVSSNVEENSDRMDMSDVSWFVGGKLNTCYNAVDRHALDPEKADHVAMIWEGDEPGSVRKLTYKDVLAKVSQIANALKTQGVKKGDVVTLYMPMIPELPLTMLACARMGAVHSVVFAGFSAEALAARVLAAKSTVVVTADIGVRAKKEIPLKGIVDDARTKPGVEDLIKNVMVWERYHDPETDSPTYDSKPKDVRMDPLVRRQRPYFPPVSMDAEDPLFILYTSGSTGMPKGLVHTTGGYSLYAAFTTRNTFDLVPETDVFACVADCGWITGHTYVVYGPLLLGGTTLLFESTPLYPDAGRYWDMVDRHKITQFYTAPTAIRSLMRFGNGLVEKYDRSSLKVLGSVGEPINPEAWRWYYNVVGEGKCTIVDTYWQTETGGHIMTNFPGITPMKPGSCSFPSYGIDAVVLDAVTGEEIPWTPGSEVEGVLAIRQPWPGMARTCLGDHERFRTVYTAPYPGYYFTGDAVRRDAEGFWFITGRVDDVLNVSGHRIGTAEVESALVLHPSVAQAAVVGKAHPVKGEGIIGFCTLKKGETSIDGDELVKELRQKVRSEIGPFASPDKLYITPNLPLTRSGKIMRRVLRKIVTDEADQLGDTSTLADPTVVDSLVAQVKDGTVVDKTSG